jgi:REP element-mobilizing transposase RayT
MGNERKNRQSYRLRGHDYSQVGEYFVTLCTKDREHLFGEITNGVVQLTKAGEIAIACWKEIPLHFTNIELDEFIVMPNHIHGILSITETLRRDVQLNIPTDDYFSRISPKRGSLAVVVRTYKAAVTTICRKNGIGEFAWQRGYYDHIIRDNDSLDRIRAYIIRNPQRWEMNE